MSPLLCFKQHYLDNKTFAVTTTPFSLTENTSLAMRAKVGYAKWYNGTKLPTGGRLFPEALCSSVLMLQAKH